MYIDKYPLVVLEDLEKLLKIIRSECHKEAFSLKEVEAGESQIAKIKAYNFSVFTFDILLVEREPNSGSIIYNYEMSPWADTVNSKKRGQGKAQAILERFNAWVSLIKRYENLDFEDPILKKYDSEIFEYFKILEDDADIDPFNIEQQVLLLRYLEKIEKIIEKEKIEIDGLNFLIEESKLSVTKESKNLVMRRISKILAKTRKSSLQLFKDFLEVFKKEMLKEAIWAGITKLNELYIIIKTLS